MLSIRWDSFGVSSRYLLAKMGLYSHENFFFWWIFILKQGWDAVSTCLRDKFLSKNDLSLNSF